MNALRCCTLLACLSRRGAWALLAKDGAYASFLDPYPIILVTVSCGFVLAVSQFFFVISYFLVRNSP